MNRDDATNATFSPAARRWLGPVKNSVAALTLFLVLGITAFSLYEFITLSVTDGDGGYPFGNEEADPAYASKETYLARTRWWVALGASFSVILLLALWRKWMTLFWSSTLVILSLALFFALNPIP
ncbi:MAG TPA: hypothetical protein VGE21_07680 [Flavobacteriales bacterium]